MTYPPAWIIALLAAVCSLKWFLRWIQQREPRHWGAILTRGLFVVIYATFTFHPFQLNTLIVWISWGLMVLFFDEAVAWLYPIITRRKHK